MAKEIGAKYYVECSAKEFQGLNELFQLAIMVILHQEAENRRKSRREKGTLL